MSILNLFRRIKLTFTTKGSAFARVAEHDAAITDAKGKVIALRAVQDVHDKAVSELENAAAEAHQLRDELDKRLKTVIAAL